MEIETQTNNKYSQASTQAVTDENFPEPQRISRTNRTTKLLTLYRYLPKPTDRRTGHCNQGFQRMINTSRAPC